MGSVRLRPSSAERWVPCPGSVVLQEAFPEPTDSENDAAREGTAAHFALESLLTNKPIVPGVIAPNGVVITAEMIEGAEQCVLDVISVAGTDPVFVEQRVTVPRIHDTECAGTPDVVHVSSGGRITVWDLKFGFGIVEAFENWQLICYALGKLDEITGGDGLKDQHMTIEMRIVQPRIYHPDGIVRKWTIEASHLRAHANIMKTSADNALGPNPTTKSGSHCKHCTARANCQTAHHASMNAIDTVSRMTAESIPDEFLATHRATLERAKEAIEHRLTGVDALIISTIQQGSAVEGLALANPLGNLKWNEPDEVILTMAELMGQDLSKKALITPTQAMRKVGESIVKNLATRSPGKTKIVKSEDTVAALVFGKK